MILSLVAYAFSLWAGLPVDNLLSFINFATFGAFIFKSSIVLIGFVYETKASRRR